MVHIVKYKETKVVLSSAEVLAYLAMRYEDKKETPSLNVSIELEGALSHHYEAQGFYDRGISFEEYNQMLEDFVVGKYVD